jgi:hypothetical protein
VKQKQFFVETTVSGNKLCGSIEIEIENEIECKT